MEFNKVLQALMAKQNTTAQQLASDLCMDKATVEHYISGEEEPALSALVLLAKYFDVTTDYLLGYRLDVEDITAEEDLLNLFRSLSDDDRAALMEQSKQILHDNECEPNQ